MYNYTSDSNIIVMVMGIMTLSLIGDYFRGECNYVLQFFSRNYDVYTRGTHHVRDQQPYQGIYVVRVLGRDLRAGQRSYVELLRGRREPESLGMMASG